MIIVTLKSKNTIKIRVKKRLRLRLIRQKNNSGQIRCKKRKPPLLKRLAECRHRPIFPEGFPSSIFGVNELNYRVRDGNGWTLITINTDCAVLFASAVSFSLDIISLRKAFVNTFFKLFYIFLKKVFRVPFSVHHALSIILCARLDNKGIHRYNY